MRVSENKLLLPGQVCLWRDGKVVWVGPLSAPWDDVECDEVMVSPSDYEVVRLRSLPVGFPEAQG